jgi:hypothetical protein
MSLAWGGSVSKLFFRRHSLCREKARVFPFKVGLKFVSKPRAYQSEAPIHSYPHSQTLDKA